MQYISAACLSAEQMDALSIYHLNYSLHSTHPLKYYTLDFSEHFLGYKFLTNVQARVYCYGTYLQQISEQIYLIPSTIQSLFHALHLKASSMNVKWGKQSEISDFQRQKQKDIRSSTQKLNYTCKIANSFGLLSGIMHNGVQLLCPFSYISVPSYQPKTTHESPSLPSSLSSMLSVTNGLNCMVNS